MLGILHRYIIFGANLQEKAQITQSQALPFYHVPMTFRWIY